ncbi:MAG: DNA replication/repair protein RecF [Akkermansiaceae bacterium]
MMLDSLRLQNFRCFDALSIELERGGALFVGDNAQGKTSILEAVCVLLRLSSPRAKRMQPMVKFDAEHGFGVAGDAGDRALRVSFSKGKAVMSVDGEELGTQTEYLQSSGLVVWMGNEDVELVKGSGGVRRHYLDFLCSQIDAGYRVALSRYRRVLKARNLLLKDGRNRDGEVNAYGELLIEYGDVLGAVREQVVGELLPKAAAVQVAISGRNEELEMEYISGSGGDMRRALETTYESERRQRQTVAGPHRDEVKLLINGMSASDYASEGQQRTMALALKLAQGEILRERGGRFPIYLLDDIFGELDSARRNALMNHLPEDSQKLITTTNVDWLSGEMGLEGWSRYRVNEGGVS